MISSRATPLGLLFLSILLVAGCGKREDAAFAKGYKEGHTDGLAAGRAEGRSEAEAAFQKRWGLVGMGVGILLGAAVVVVATRKHLSAQWRKRRQRREIERTVGNCRADLSPELHEEVISIARKKAALQNRLAEDDGPLIAALADRIRPELVRLDTKVLEIASLLQDLRDLRQETLPQGNARRWSKRVSRSESDHGREGVETLEELREQRRAEITKNAENIARCENQLAGLAAFLDQLQVRVGNLKTLEQADAFERFEEEVGREIDTLAATFETTLARLSQGI